MEIFRSPAEMISWSKRTKASGKRIGLIPTMGAFHQGHVSLMRLALRESDCRVVSLFVNPIQFGPQEDFAKYPRDFDRDAKLAAEERIDVLFIPAQNEMYPDNFHTRVIVEDLTDTLCGKSRPGHFGGVATVVAKLFNIVLPYCAVFGEKDFQQLAVVRRLVEDLNFPVKIIGHSIVREQDGLAMSSRNSYLSFEQRKSALCLFASIERAKKMVAEGVIEPELIVNNIIELIHSYQNVSVEYVNIVDEKTLADVSSVGEGAVLAMAVTIGNTRLIDNCKLVG